MRSDLHCQNAEPLFFSQKEDQTPQRCCPLEAFLATAKLQSSTSPSTGPEKVSGTFSISEKVPDTFF